MLGLEQFRAALQEDKRVWPLLVMVCCTMFGAGLVVPVLSLYAASFGVSATLVGMLVTIFGIGRIVANFPSGWLSQRMGRRPLLAAGPALVAVGAVGAALTTDFNWLLFWRFVQGVGSGMYQTVSLAALADISSPQTRGRLVGVYNAAIQFGASIGPFIGGTVASLFGLAAPFWVLLVISIVTCTLAIATFKDAEIRITRSMSGPLGAKRRGLLSAPFIVISLVTCVVFFTRTACMFQLLPLIGNETFGLGVAAIGVGITVIAFAMLVVLPISGVFIEKFGSRLMVIVSMLGMIAGIGLVLMGTHQIFFWLSMLIYGLAGGANSAATGTFTIEVLPRHKYGEGMGLQRTISDIGYVLGPVIAGLVADLSGFGNAGGIVATLALAAITTVVFIFVSAGTGGPVKQA
jgi:DHA1 family multidrug resistance protein-like MFS transporter